MNNEYGWAVINKKSKLIDKSGSFKRFCVFSTREAARNYKYDYCDIGKYSIIKIKLQNIV